MIRIRQRIWLGIVIVLLIAFGASQYMIYQQNKVISSYSDMIDQWVEAYGNCMGRKMILRDKHKRMIQIKFEGENYVSEVRENI